MSSANNPEARTASADTNVLVSSFLLRGSTSFRALAELGERYKLILSIETLDELERVVRRTKFDKYVPLHERLALLLNYVSGAAIVPVYEQVRACRDPRDDKFLELAVSGRADLVLTGDADLLALHPFRGIAILTPAAYLASLDE